MISNLSDYKISKTSLLERFLLFFVKPSYIKDGKDNIISIIKYKKMFDKVYILGHYCSVQRKGDSNEQTRTTN